MILVPAAPSRPRRLRLPLLLLLAAAPWAAANQFHLAPTGNDRNPGTAAAPFASLLRAQQSARPGDTVWIHGGVYHITENQIAARRRVWCYVMEMNRSGTPGHPITYSAAPNEHPEFDFSAVKPPGQRITAFHVTGSWLRFIGLSVTGVQVTIKGHTQSECFDNEGDHNHYERLEMHDGQAIGFWLGRGSDNLILNCDAFRNHDFTSENGRGGNVDGFGFHPPAGSERNVFRGCRAWFNSDDGYDCINSGSAVTYDHCWAFCNGFNTQFRSLGDGNGFKTGGFGVSPDANFPNPIPRHTVRNCLAVHNKAHGFYANHHPGGNDWLQNSAFRNHCDFSMLGRAADKSHDIPGTGHTLVGNVAFQGRSLLADIQKDACRMENNSFTLTLTERDFASLDEAELMKPRKPDGSLPDLRFLSPARGGNLDPARHGGTTLGALPMAGTTPRP